MLWQAGQRTHRNQRRAAMAAPIVGENSIGMCASCRAFHDAISFSASANICGPSARRASASFAAFAARSLSILRRVKPMPLRLLGADHEYVRSETERIAADTNRLSAVVHSRR